MHLVASDRASCTSLAFRHRSNRLLGSTAWSKHSRAQTICCAQQSSSLTPSIRASTRKGTPRRHPLIRTPVEGNTSPQQGRIKRVSLPTKHFTSNKEQAGPKAPMNENTKRSLIVQVSSTMDKHQPCCRELITPQTLPTPYPNGPTVNQISAIWLASGDIQYHGQKHDNDPHTLFCKRQIKQHKLLNSTIQWIAKRPSSLFHAPHRPQPHSSS